MSKSKHYSYIAFVSFIAVLMYGSILLTSTQNLRWQSLIFWTILAVVAESFHIEMPSGAATSVGMAIYLAALVIAGPVVATTAPIAAFIFRFPEVQGERWHLFKYHPTIVIYNIASHVVFVGAISHLYVLFISSSSNFSQKIVVSLILLTIGELISIVLISIYFYTRNGVNEIPLFKGFLGALPSTWAVGALGLFLAFAADNFGEAIVGLFFVPLLLTRYSFKLYFDSQKMGMETIKALNETLSVRDLYTASHTERVEEYSVMLGKALNYSPSALDKLRKAARLHDIGKIGIPDGILNKPGQLTDVEYEKIKDHASMGAQILSNVDSLKKITEIIRYHHERPDGKGYPEGLMDDKIPRDSAILAIADTYDAMTSDRPYRKALSKEIAVGELVKYKGKQFNAYLVDVFVAHIDAHEAAKELDCHSNEIKDVIELKNSDAENVSDKAAEVSA